MREINSVTDLLSGPLIGGSHICFDLGVGGPSGIEGIGGLDAAGVGPVGSVPDGSGGWVGGYGGGYGGGTPLAVSSWTDPLGWALAGSIGSTYTPVGGRGGGAGGGAGYLVAPAKVYSVGSEPNVGPLDIPTGPNVVVTPFYSPDPNMAHTQGPITVDTSRAAPEGGGWYSQLPGSSPLETRQGFAPLDIASVKAGLVAHPELYYSKDIVSDPTGKLADVVQVHVSPFLEGVLKGNLSPEASALRGEIRGLVGMDIATTPSRGGGNLINPATGAPQYVVQLPASLSDVGRSVEIGAGQTVSSPFGIFGEGGAEWGMTHPLQGYNPQPFGQFSLQPHGIPSYVPGEYPYTGSSVLTSLQILKDLNTIPGLAGALRIVPEKGTTSTYFYREGGVQKSQQVGGVSQVKIGSLFSPQAWDWATGLNNWGKLELANNYFTNLSKDLLGKGYKTESAWAAEQAKLADTALGEYLKGTFTSRGLQAPSGGGLDILKAASYLGTAHDQVISGSYKTAQALEDQGYLQRAQGAVDILRNPMAIPFNEREEALKSAEAALNDVQSKGYGLSIDKSGNVSFTSTPDTYKGVSPYNPYASMYPGIEKAFTPRPVGSTYFDSEGKPYMTSIPTVQGEKFFNLEGGVIPTPRGFTVPLAGVPSGRDPFAGGLQVRDDKGNFNPEWVKAISGASSPIGKAAVGQGGLLAAPVVSENITKPGTRVAGVTENITKPSGAKVVEPAASGSRSAVDPSGRIYVVTRNSDGSISRAMYDSKAQMDRGIQSTQVCTQGQCSLENERKFQALEKELGLTTKAPTIPQAPSPSNVISFKTHITDEGTRGGPTTVKVSNLIPVRSPADIPEGGSKVVVTSSAECPSCPGHTREWDAIAAQFPGTKFYIITNADEDSGGYGGQYLGSATIIAPDGSTRIVEPGNMGQVEGVLRGAGLGGGSKFDTNEPSAPQVSYIRAPEQPFDLGKGIGDLFGNIGKVISAPVIQINKSLGLVLPEGPGKAFSTGVFYTIPPVWTLASLISSATQERGTINKGIQEAGKFLGQDTGPAIAGLVKTLTSPIVSIESPIPGLEAYIPTWVSHTPIATVLTAPGVENLDIGQKVAYSIYSFLSPLGARIKATTEGQMQSGNPAELEARQASLNSRVESFNKEVALAGSSLSPSQADRFEGMRQSLVNEQAQLDLDRSRQGSPLINYLGAGYDKWAEGFFPEGLRDFSRSASGFLSSPVGIAASVIMPGLSSLTTFATPGKEIARQTIELPALPYEFIPVVRTVGNWGTNVRSGNIAGNVLNVGLDVLAAAPIAWGARGAIKPGVISWSREVGQAFRSGPSEIAVLEYSPKPTFSMPGIQDLALRYSKFGYDVSGKIADVRAFGIKGLTSDAPYIGNKPLIKGEVPAYRAGVGVPETTPLGGVQGVSPELVGMENFKPRGDLFARAEAQYAVEFDKLSRYLGKKGGASLVETPKPPEYIIPKKLEDLFEAQYEAYKSGNRSLYESLGKDIQALSQTKPIEPGKVIKETSGEIWRALAGKPRSSLLSPSPMKIPGSEEVIMPAYLRAAEGLKLARPGSVFSGSFITERGQFSPFRAAITSRVGSPPAIVSSINKAHVQYVSPGVFRTSPKGSELFSTSPSGGSVVVVPVQTPLQAPVQTSIQTPVEVPMQVPVQIPVQTPVQVLVQRPAQTPVQTPTKTPVWVGAPVLVPVRTPVQTPIRVPVQTPVRVPVQVPVQIPMQVPVQTPVRAPVQTPVRTPFIPPVPILPLGGGLGPGGGGGYPTRVPQVKGPLGVWQFRGIPVYSPNPLLGKGLPKMVGGWQGRKAVRYGAAKSRILESKLDQLQAASLGTSSKGVYSR